MEIIRLKRQREKKRKAIDRQAAFVEFKQTPEGKEIEEGVVSSRVDLKDRKERIKELTAKCNACKKELDVYLRKLDGKAAEKREAMQ
mmetsp:Transcript_7286/g.5566  ORF Transcript_7286/g.5566 Transcript_7286/m.5566 type:complete len:87 (+) Transcript_7286:412-672(+)